MAGDSGRLVFAAVGAVAGAVIGYLFPPAGASIIQAVLGGAAAGGAVGSLAGSLILPGPHTTGQRLNDLSITASTYGGQIPIGTGTFRMGGNVIWGTALQEIGVHHGGKGLSKPSSTTFTYAANFAIGLTRGPIAAVTRIWANNALIYDATATTDVNLLPGLHFTVYTGTETQLPDPLMESFEGVGNVPAYRGLAYIVFNQLPLEIYGNRIPNINVEVAYVTADSLAYYPIIPLGGSIFDSFDPTQIAADPQRLIGWVLGNSGTATTGVATFDIQSMQVTREATFDDALAPVGLSHTDLAIGFGGLYSGFATGGLYFQCSGNILVRIDPDTLLATGKYEIPGLFLVYDFCEIAAEGSAGTTAWLLILSATGDYILLNAVAMTLAATGSWKLPFSAGGGVAIPRMSPGLVTIGKGEAWIVYGWGSSVANGQTMFLVNVQIAGSGAAASVTTEQRLVLDVSDFDPAVTPTGYISSLSLQYDAINDASVIIATVVEQFSVGPITVWVAHFSSVDNAVTYIAALPGTTPSGLTSMSNLSSGSMAWFTNDQAYIFDLSAGNVVYQKTWPAGHVSSWTQLYDGLTKSLISNFATHGWSKVHLDRLSIASATLQDAYDAILTALPSVTSADYDTSDLASVPLTGFGMGQTQSAAAALAPLAQVFRVDAVDSDGIITFKLRGGAIVTTITENEFLRQSGQNAPEPFQESRTQEIGLPRSLTITFLDPARDNQANTQGFTRPRSPRSVIYSDATIDSQINVVMSATTAAQMAEKLSTTAWVERHGFAMRLSQTYAWLDTADPVDIVLNDGYTARVRIGPLHLGADFTLDAKMIEEWPGQYISTATATAPPIPVNTIPAYFPAKMFLLDVPLLRDHDDLGAGAMRGYWGAGMTNESLAFAAARLEESHDAVAFAPIDTLAVRTAWGVINTPPADPASVFRTQSDGVLVVDMIDGGSTLASVTALQMLNGYNAAALEKANGDVEIIQFQTVTPLGGTLYELSVLLRGRRGTDTMATGHLSGETIVMLHVATTHPILLPIADAGVGRFWRAITAGSFGSLTAGFTFHGRDKKPYAPVDVTATLSGSPPDIVLAWVRRTRVGGELSDFISAVPLSETSEAYEVDIYDAPGTTVLRTLTGLSSPAATYTHAQIVADFGSPPSSLNVKVYQLSGSVGRGFGRLDALEVT